jgi:hypothetical protein
MGDSVPKHTGPNSLTDTHPRTERLQNPPDHHQRESPEMGSQTRELKRLADLIGWRRNPLLSSTSLK